MASRTITRSAVASLQNNYVRAAQSFQTYNFREYFLRVAERKFSTDLGGILGSSTIQKLSLPSISSTSTSNTTSTSSESGNGTGQGEDSDLLQSLGKEEQSKLVEWWNRSEADLEAWKRASIVNNLFLAPRLVVEGQGNVMTSGGGGAGMEASAGGGGQPTNPEGDKHHNVSKD